MSGQSDFDRVMDKEYASGAMPYVSPPYVSPPADVSGWDSIFAVVVSIFIILLIFALYFLPLLIAYKRGHHNFSAIAVLNLLTGWTGLGWIAALIWSLTAVWERE